MKTIRTIAIVFGAVLTVVGIAGFIPALTPDGKLLGIFAVDTPHNLVHLLSGLAGITTGLTSTIASRRYFQIFGTIYALVTVAGLFFIDHSLFGLMAHNFADLLLHVVISTTALYLGFRRDEES